MSKTTLRKRISLVAVSALTAGVLSAVVAPAANANIAASSNAVATTGTMNVAVGSNTTGATTTDANPSNAKSLGLLYKDASSTTAQTATVIAGAALVLYTKAAATATFTAWTATGGSFGTPVGGGGTQAATTVEYGVGNASIAISGTNATDVAVRWAAPTTAGTYTVSMWRSTDTTQISSLATRTSGTLTGVLTVTVQAAAASDAPVVANSSCFTATSGTLTSADSTSANVANGSQWYINFALRNAYVSNVSTSGNLVVTSSSPDAVVSLGSGTHAAGTGATAVQYGTGAAGSSYDSIRVDQATAGKPVTTTISLSYDGAVVCTKTVTITGEASSMSLGSVSSVALNGSTANANWLADGTNRDGHFTITLKDSAGNLVLPSASTEFSVDATTVTTTVTAVVVDSGDQATSTSSSLAAWNYSVGKFTCGPVAGSSKVTLKHTSASTGKVVTAVLDGRCAGDAYTYTASFDKAAYTQGEIATLTVKFLDSKGNPANSQTAVGAVTNIMPMLTFVSATGAASALTKADGTLSYTLTVGTTTGMTAGTYNGIIDFTGLTAVAATKQTVTYKLSTGGDTTTNADVLKSIVALIASINKQIQALQKLILKR